ncbi:hypothetical protein STSP1_00728 [Sedimentisphaera salicampi]|uniref:PIN domain-containing protein n=1 Tax=Sedimentisphaera salicampi TaxID=1941349 RepID=A0A1W6LKM7_9BACT|nr:hypothetical protein STSP1_00728 [Sedimentisphaera salicampi]
MMNEPNRIHKLSSYSFSNGEEILIDANIWLYLYPAPAGLNKRKYAAQYSGSYKIISVNLIFV